MSLYALESEQAIKEIKDLPRVATERGGILI